MDYSNTQNLFEKIICIKDCMYLNKILNDPVDVFGLKFLFYVFKILYKMLNFKNFDRNEIRYKKKRF